MTGLGFKSVFINYGLPKNIVFSVEELIQNILKYSYFNLSADLRNVKSDFMNFCEKDPSRLYMVLFLRSLLDNYLGAN